MIAHTILLFLVYLLGLVNIMVAAILDWEWAVGKLPPEGPGVEVGVPEVP